MRVSYVYMCKHGWMYIVYVGGCSHSVHRRTTAMQMPSKEPIHLNDIAAAAVQGTQLKSFLRVFLEDGRQARDVSRNGSFHEHAALNRNFKTVKSPCIP
jgi:hypothetical protein